jgi:hypothetical protein
MATEKEYVSAHLNENYHVFNNGTTGKLCVTPWNRNTVADGYWQNVNTIKPLINRDIYLAECLDEIASKYTVYTPGDGIKITPNPVSEDNYIISIDPEYTTNMPTYDFDTKTMNVVTDEEHKKKTVSVKLKQSVDEYQALTADENGIYANIDYMLSSTSALSSESVYSATYTSGLTYTYLTGQLNVEYVSAIPADTIDGKIYVIG